jgi:hypothetical protein
VVKCRSITLNQKQTNHLNLQQFVSLDIIKLHKKLIHLFLIDESKILNKTKINNIVDNKVKELKNDLFKTLFG